MRAAVGLQRAKALDMQHKIGSLTLGKQADLIVIEQRALNFAPLLRPVNQIMFNGQPQHVEWVFVAGRALKEKGKVTGVNQGPLLKAAQIDRPHHAFHPAVTALPARGRSAGRDVKAQPGPSFLRPTEALGRAPDVLAKAAGPEQAMAVAIHRWGEQHQQAVVALGDAVYAASPAAYQEWQIAADAHLKDSLRLVACEEAGGQTVGYGCLWPVHQGHVRLHLVVQRCCRGLAGPPPSQLRQVRSVQAHRPGRRVGRRPQRCPCQCPWFHQSR
jgi:hypothetical protein